MERRNGIWMEKKRRRDTADQTEQPNVMRGRGEQKQQIWLEKSKTERDHEKERVNTNIQYSRQTLLMG